MVEFDLTKGYYCPICQKENGDTIELKVAPERGGGGYWDGHTHVKIDPVKPWIRGKCTRNSRNHVFRLVKGEDRNSVWLCIDVDKGEYNGLEFPIIT